MCQKISQSGEKNNNMHIRFKNSEVNKLEVDEHRQWNEKVRSHRFCLHMLAKNRNYEGRDQIDENRSLSPWR